MNPVLHRILENWRLHCRPPGFHRVLVAVSGGVDSVVLLRSLALLAADEGLELAVAHFNHRLRGREADADQTFVNRLAGELGLPFFEGCAEVRSASAATRESLEMTGRRLRHAYLATAAQEWKADCIALAHHADDQAELFLIRLFRGAGGTGLGGMRWSSPSPSDPRIPLVRPLLNLSKAELKTWARSEACPFREDKSNRDRSIPRNRIRHELLPLLEAEYQPGIRSVLNRTAELLGDEAAFVDETARRWRTARRRTPFHRLHPAVQRAVLRVELWELGHVGGFDLVEQLRSRTTQISIGRGIAVCREAAGGIREVRSQPRPQTVATRIQVDLKGSSGTVPLGDGALTWTIQASRGRTTARSPAGTECFDLGSVGKSIVLRHWRSGDRFQPLGLSNPARLQNLFVNRKVPAALRRHLWVAEAESGELVWVERMPPGETFKLRPATRRVLKLSIVRTAAPAV